MKWIILARYGEAVSHLAYEFEARSDAQVFFDYATENSIAKLRMFEATLVAERNRAFQHRR
jgi:hypothetical protein